jgi:uncharacterized membrane protein
VRVEQSVTVDAPRAEVWDFVTDPANYCEFIEGATRWEVVSDNDRGLGARYRMLLKVGSAQVGGLIEVVEWSPPGDMAWSSVMGIDQRGRWRLREASGGRTRLTFRFAYGVAGGGISALIAERVAAPSLRRRFRKSLLNVKQAVEERAMTGAISR